MPEPVVIVIALVGLIMLGLAFSAINLLQSAGRIVALSLFMFVTILLIQRFLPGTITTSVDRGISEAERNLPLFGGERSAFSDYVDSIVFGNRLQAGWQDFSESLAAPGRAEASAELPLRTGDELPARSLTRPAPVGSVPTSSSPVGSTPTRPAPVVGRVPPPRVTRRVDPNAPTTEPLPGESMTGDIPPRRPVSGMW